MRAGAGLAGDEVGGRCVGNRAHQPGGDVGKADAAYRLLRRVLGCQYAADAVPPPSVEQVVDQGRGLPVLRQCRQLVHHEQDVGRLGTGHDASFQLSAQGADQGVAVLVLVGVGYDVGQPLQVGQLGIAAVYKPELAIFRAGAGSQGSDQHL